MIEGPIPRPTCEGHPAILCVSRLLGASHCRTQRVKSAQQTSVSCLLWASHCRNQRVKASPQSSVRPASFQTEDGIFDARVRFAISPPNFNVDRAWFQDSSWITQHKTSTLKFGSGRRNGAWDKRCCNKKPFSEANACVPLAARV